MPRYIDAKEAIMRVKFDKLVIHFDPKTGIDFVSEYDQKLIDACVNRAITRINETPTADVVKVIHCKDCKLGYGADEYEIWCNGWGWPARMVTEEMYCSRGLPKDDE